MASSSSSLRRWISDHSIKFFGMSESSMIDYIALTAASAPSSDALFASLSALGLPASPEGEAFARQLYAKTPRPEASVPRRAEATQEKAKEQTQRYGLILDDDAQEQLAIRPEKRRKKKKKPEEGEGDEAGPSKRTRGASEQAEAEPDEPEEVRLERERLRDIAERDEFAKRMRERDKGGKALVEDRGSKLNPEVAARRLLAEDAEARAAAMPGLRDRSRQEYLAKRSAQQLELLRLEVADEERYMRGIKATKREIRDLEYKKEVLRLAEEREGIQDGHGGYMMPEDYITEQGKLDSKKKQAALYQRCESGSKQARRRGRAAAGREAEPEVSGAPQTKIRRTSAQHMQRTSPTLICSSKSSSQRPTSCRLLAPGLGQGKKRRSTSTCLTRNSASTLSCRPTAWKMRLAWMRRTPSCRSRSRRRRAKVRRRGNWQVSEC